GGVFLSLLYTIPVLSLILWKLFGVLGLGMVVYRIVLISQREKPAAAPVAAATAPAAAGGSPSVAAVFGTPMPPTIPPTPASSAALTPISAITLPRAGFWIRIAAALIDAVLIGMIFGVMNAIWHGFGRAFPMWYALYCVIMWATKGTTVGGIICGLKIVRIDDRPVDWSVAIVRALGGFLSLCIAGLGFIWVAFDNDKQSWHDKIAGTTIVRVPKGTPLL
ncbi:MAG TPA: RDD family protein, partial [Candidatus Didemnitutus sp.]|nr:RDD family protein [Candidatus Didemnitutus sp.]